MTRNEETALAKRLSKGAQATLLMLTDDYTLPGRATFNANSAFNLEWTATRYGGLAEAQFRNNRSAYRITPLGKRIRDRITAMESKP